MRILLIFLQTVAFLVLAAAILLALWGFANRLDFSESDSLLKNIIVAVFGNWLVDLLIFLALAAANAWFVLGPLLKVEDPVRRTVTSLCLICIETLFLLAIGALSFAVMALCGTAPS